MVFKLDYRKTIFYSNGPLEYSFSINYRMAVTDLIIVLRFGGRNREGETKCSFLLLLPLAYLFLHRSCPLLTEYVVTPPPQILS
jgi:hypothetical protein